MFRSHTLPLTHAVLLSIPVSLAVIGCAVYLGSLFSGARGYESSGLLVWRNMPPKPTLNPASFPRPPLLERTARHLQVKWNGSLIADTREGFWVLETWHPPTYYLPPSSLQPPFSSLLTKSPHSSMCEWKGAATYWDLSLPNNLSPGNPPSSSTADSTSVRNRIWSYEAPTPTFEAIRGYLSFYAGPWQCFVDGEEVEAQPGDFYGGWMTSDVLKEKVKGRAGTNWW